MPGFTTMGAETVWRRGGDCMGMFTSEVSSRADRERAGCLAGSGGGVVPVDEEDEAAADEGAASGAEQDAGREPGVAIAVGHRGDSGVGRDLLTRAGDRLVVGNGEDGGAR